MQILVVHPQSAVREMLRSQLDQALQDDHLLIDPAGTEVEALRRIRKQQSDPYAALITSLDLPHDHASVSDPAGRGFRLVEALAATGSKRTKCLIMSPAGTHLGSSMQIKNMYCLFLEDGPGMFERMVSATRDAVTYTKKEPRLSVKFVQDPNTRNWKCSLDGLPGFNQSVNFELPSLEMRRLVQRSAGLGTMREEWLHELVKIGKQLRELIFQNHDLANLLQAAVGTAGGIERMRFSFNVSRDMFSLAVEALVGPETEVLGFSPASRESSGKRAGKNLTKSKNGKAKRGKGRYQDDKEENVELASFWMLRAPIYRSLSVNPAPISLGQSRSALFEDGRKPINCLIIESDTAGEVRVPGNSDLVSLPELGNVDIECEWLEGQIRDRRNQDEWGINHVKRINLATVPANQSFSRHLEDTLAEREWHLVHYSGHSLYVPAKKGSVGRGFLFLPGTKGKIEVLDAGFFANWLNDAEFLFLSSCHSSEESFAFEMARNGVPAVLGFRWDIRDDLAADFAAKFYEGLFHFRSIESAFVAARIGVRRDHGAKEQVWAAPMLVLVDSHRPRIPTA